MIFIDGVGIGNKDFQSNPFFKYGFKTFEKIFDDIPSLDNPVLKKNNYFLFPADATLGVVGLPQSGTGQASIYCGFNVPEFVGKHYGPFPYSTTIPILQKKHILLHFRDKYKSSFFANAYPKVFFNYLDSGKSRLSVTTLTCKLSGIKSNTVTDVRKGNALTSEITNTRWNERLGYKLPELKPKNAARRLLKIAKKHKFTLYEYYLSDHLGHLRLAKEFKKLFTEMDEFLLTILSEVDQKNMTLLICSDHGNLEDLSIKTHTLNPALTITSGLNAERIFKSIKDLTNIRPAIIKFCR
jgi:hypothetical protein